MCIYISRYVYTYIYMFIYAPSNLEEVEGHEGDLDDGSHVRRDRAGSNQQVVQRTCEPTSVIETCTCGHVHVRGKAPNIHGHVWGKVPGGSQMP